MRDSQNERSVQVSSTSSPINRCLLTLFQFRSRNISCDGLGGGGENRGRKLDRAFGEVGDGGSKADLRRWYRDSTAPYEASKAEALCSHQIVRSVD